jgi:hypothetical protein
MDGPDLPTFRTPTRILLPKLLKSRDAWKHKYQQRRKQNKALQINVRDLTASRESWRTQCHAAQAERDQLITQRNQLQAERDQLIAQRQAAPKK